MERFYDLFFTLKGYVELRALRVLVKIIVYAFSRVGGSVWKMER